MFNIFYGGPPQNPNGGGNRGRFGLITRRCLCTNGMQSQTCSGLGSAFSIFGGPGHTDCTEICTNCMGPGATGYFIDVPQRRRTRR